MGKLKLRHLGRPRIETRKYARHDKQPLCGCLSKTGLKQRIDSGRVFGMAGGGSDGVSSKTKHGRRQINITLRREPNQMRSYGVTGIIDRAAADTLQQVLVKTVPVGNRAGVIASQYLRELSTANGVTVEVIPNFMIERKHA